MLTTCLLFLIPRRPACHVHDDLTRSPHPTTHTLSSDMDLFLTAGRLLRTSQCHLYGLTMAYVQSGYGSTDIVTFSYRCTKSSFTRRGFRWRSTCQAFGVRLPPSEILFFLSSSWSRFLPSHDLFYWHSEQFASFFYLNHTMLTLRVVSPAACVVWCCWSFFTARFSASLRWLSASFCCNEWIACMRAGVKMGGRGCGGKERG